MDTEKKPEELVELEEALSTSKAIKITAAAVSKVKGVVGKAKGLFGAFTNAVKTEVKAIEDAGKEDDSVDAIVEDVIEK